MQREMFIFRIAKGREGGAFTGECPLGFKAEFEQDIMTELNNISIGQIPYETNNYLDYLHRELWQCGKLRQGWGIDGLDLSCVLVDDKAASKWIKNYVIGLKKYWNVDPLCLESGYTKDYLPCHEASGRMQMLAQIMLCAKPSDIIFIPKHSFQNHHDDNSFTVCEVVGKYYFDLNPLYQDFGHILSVRNLKTFQYGDCIQGMDFSGYYQRAVSKVETHHKIYQHFFEFVKREYLPLLP